MKNLLQQPFHLVTVRPWPILTSINIIFLIIGITKIFNFNIKINLFLRFINISFCAIQWWRDTTRERYLQGYHTVFVIEGIKLGIIFFIVSEVFFFVSFFWSYLHIFLSPRIEIGQSWPPLQLKNFILNPYDLPLLNSIILIRSGIFLSIAHYAIIIKKFNKAYYIIYITLILAIIFTYIQYYEYSNTIFSIFTSSYGSTFFIITGFHGIHVIIGTIFIFIILIRLKSNQFSNIHNVGFEARAWYWHFVDVVWLLLFLLVYWLPY